MTDGGDTTAAAATALVYADTLPLAWTPREGGFDAGLLARLNQDNLRLLHAVAALEEYTAEPADDDATAHALARLDLKVALLLELVGKLLMARGDLPASVPVRLGSRRLIWSDTTGSFRPGDAGIAAVWLRASPATPLQIAGEVAAVRPQDVGREVELIYLGLDESVGEALEKLIFRHHRRSIANRHPGPPR